MRLDGTSMRRGETRIRWNPARVQGPQPQCRDHRPDLLARRHLKRHEMILEPERREEITFNVQIAAENTPRPAAEDRGPE